MVSMPWQPDDVEDGDFIDVIGADGVGKDIGRVALALAVVAGVLDMGALVSSVLARVKAPVTMPPPITVTIAIFMASDCELNQCFSPMRRSMPS